MNLKCNTIQAGIGSSERRALDALSRTGKAVVRAHDLEEQLGVSTAYANSLLFNLCKKGWLQRLQTSIYRIVPLGSYNANPVPDDAWAIGMALFAPCYISGWTAAEHWDLTEQIFNSTIILSAKKQRHNDHVIAGLKYKTKLISNQNIFGIKKIWSSNTQIQIADIHRTIIDILADPVIGGGGRQTIDIVKEYFVKPDADLAILCQYAEKLKQGAVFKRLGFLMEKFAQPSPTLLEQMHSNIKKGIIRLDPHGPSVGHINTRWGILINIPLDDKS